MERRWTEITLVRTVKDHRELDEEVPVRAHLIQVDGVVLTLVENWAGRLLRYPVVFHVLHKCITYLD